jgi:hypothetical protein
MPFDKIYMDMDGVLCDFDKQCHNLFKDMEKSETAMEYKKRIGSNKFWRHIKETKGEFWRTMEPIDNLSKKELQEIWNKLSQYCNDIIILSSPVLSDHKCIEGKSYWIDNNLGLGLDSPIKRIFTKDKFKYASENSLLVDDLEKFVEPWKEHGGKAILFKGSYDDEFWSLLNSGLY